MDIRNFIFKNRGIIPVPIVLYLIFLSNPGMYFHSFLGFGLILLGESLRINSVRYAGGKTRSVHLKSSGLATNGPYAYVRNPIYIGNTIIWCGAVLLSNTPFLLPTVFFIFLFFSVEYNVIISLEEEYLSKEYGNQYLKYKKNVPKLIPKFSKWDGGKNFYKNNLIDTIKIEKSTLQGLGLFFLIIIIKSIYFIN
tara:strand:+ start:2000 stop:2584 length:585 start_codon:yes stop_codon:yes gene_type:complete